MLGSLDNQAAGTHVRTATFSRLVSARCPRASNVYASLRSSLHGRRRQSTPSFVRFARSTPVKLARRRARTIATIAQWLRTQLHCPTCDGPGVLASYSGTFLSGPAGSWESLACLHEYIMDRPHPETRTVRGLKFSAVSCASSQSRSAAAVARRLASFTSFCVLAQAMATTTVNPAHPYRSIHHFMAEA